MASNFVPFSPGGRAKAAVSPGGFSPVASAVGEGAAVEGCSSPGCGPGGEVKVDLKKDGDRITQIRIQCRCGEVIEIDCQY